MLLFIILAILLAKMQKKKIGGILPDISLLPLWICEIIFWVFQICAWTGDYRFVPYAAMLQTAYILSLIWPILRFRLYIQAMCGATMVAVGSLLNRLVMHANAGQMPVYSTLSRLTGYFRIGAIEASGDARHVLMSASTHLNFLGDFIDIGFSIMSLGDLLIHGFVTLIVYSVITKLNEGRDG